MIKQKQNLPLCNHRRVQQCPLEQEKVEVRLKNKHKKQIKLQILITQIKF